MNLFFEILVFLLLISSIVYNVYLQKQFLLLKYDAEIIKEVKIEKVIEKSNKKEETPEDKMIAGLNNLLTYDGSPNKKE
jgi:hypothetical protein